MEPSQTDAAWVSGGCLCGGVRYEVDPTGAFDAGYCHCSMCRRASGAPVLAWALLRRDTFRLITGALNHYRSSDVCRRAFCPTCGSQLFYEIPNEPDMIGIHTATLDHPAPLPLRPRLHMFADDQLCWFALHDSLPRFVDNRLPHPDRRT